LATKTRNENSSETGGTKSITTAAWQTMGQLKWVQGWLVMLLFLWSCVNVEDDDSNSDSDADSPIPWVVERR